MILVTGANGQLGRRIVHHLIARLGTTAGLAVSVRDPARAADLADKGIAVRPGDFDHPQALPAAFAGADKLVLISSDGPAAVRIAQHRNAVAAAREAGVKHVIYTSFLDVAPDSPAEFAAVHRATEAALAASGMRYTALRNPLYADLLPTAFGGALESGVFYLPAGSGKVSFIGRDELAEAAAAAALAPALAKEVYELTGEATHDYHQVAAAVARVTGKAVRYQPVAPEDYARALESHGLPGWLAGALAGMFGAAAAGHLDRVTHDFAALVGHPPRPLDCLVQELFAPR